MPRTRHVSRTPLAEAARYYGSEAEALRAAKTKETRRDWKKFGVPADVLLPITMVLADQFLARRLPPVADRAQQLPEWHAEMEEIAKLEAKARGDLLEVLRDLRAILARDRDLFASIRNWIRAQRTRLDPPLQGKKRKSG